MKPRLFIIPFTFFLAITFLITITSCSKDGNDGATGPAGPAGAAGAAGATGTANIIYSDWLNVTFQSSGPAGWVADIPAPNLVDSILNKGEIKVYWNPASDSSGGQNIIPLPTNEQFLIGIDIEPYFTKQNIKLRSTENASSYILRTYNYSQFRYILIPGGVKAGKGIKTVDWNNYKEVQKYLGLMD